MAMAKHFSIIFHGAPNFFARDADRVDLNAFDQTMIGVQFKQPV
jgi:hypothetical protein